MTKIVSYTFKLLLLFLVLSAVACDRPKEIEEADLREIVEETYLVNAYMQNHATLNVRGDSLDIYRPVLKKYGYTIEDLRYTMESYSRRKSSRMSDIMRDAVANLEKESGILTRKVEVLDSVNARAVRMFTREVFRDSTIRVDAVKDTADLRLMLPVDKGLYTVSYAGFVDSLDKNNSLRTTMVLINTAGRRVGSSAMTNYLPRGRRVEQSSILEAGQNGMTLKILFGNYRKDLSRPHITIDSLRVVYAPTLEMALDSLTRHILGKEYSFYTDEYLQKDSVARHTLFPWIAPQRDSIP